MVICLYTKSDTGVPFQLMGKNLVMFHNGSLRIIIAESDQIVSDDVWKRIPLSYALTISEKDSTVWDFPDTRNSGDTIIKNMISSWCASLTNYRKEDVA